MRRARRSCGTVAATWLRESCAARVPGATFIFYLLHDAPPVAVRNRFAGPGAAPSGVRPASRHPPPAAARLGARPSRSPVGREPARRRAARGRAPAAEGSGLRARPGGKRRPHGTTTRGAPPSDAKYGTDSRGESAKARARGPSTPARGANRQRTAPLAARVEARGNGNGWGGRAVGDSIIPPDSSRPIAPAGLQKYRRCGFHALLDETGALSRLCIIWHLGSAG